MAKRAWAGLRLFGFGFGFWQAPSPCPHRLKGVQGLRHGGAKEAPGAASHPWPLHMGGLPVWGCAPGFGTPPGIDPAISRVLSACCTAGPTATANGGGWDGMGWDGSVSNTCQTRRQADPMCQRLVPQAAARWTRSHANHH